MNRRQHRCPYYLLGITPNDLKNIKLNKDKTEKLICSYQQQINSLSAQYNQLKAIFDKILNIVQPFINDRKIFSLEEVVDNSLLNSRTKKSTISLINKYSNYCKNKLEQTINSNNGKSNIKDLPIIYDPQNAFDFITSEKNKYKRGSVKKNLNTLLRYIKLATKNPFLEYELPIGKGEPSKLKHIITKEELKKFIKYLNNQKLYIIIATCLLMYKFGIRIGAIAKLKVCDLLMDNIIIFSLL